MSNLSDLIPAGGGQNNADFVADGGITSGKPVILTAAGKAAPITGATEAVGTPVVFEAANTGGTACTFDSDSNKVVIAYSDNDNSSYGTGIVGTVSGTAISYGSPTVFASVGMDKPVATFDSNSNKVVIAYRDSDNSSYGTAVVGTVSGTGISFGTPVVFESASINFDTITFDSDSNKVVIAYNDIGNSGYGTGIVGTVSGTAISFGTAAVFESAEVGDCSATFDSNENKVVVAYRDGGNSWYGTAAVGTVSGTSISFGTPVVFELANTESCAATFDSNSNKVVIAYKDGGNSGYGTAIVGTVSGTAISFGTAVAFETARSEAIVATFDSNANRVVLAYKDYGGSGHGETIAGTVSGTAISFGTPAVFEAADIEYNSITFDSNSNKVVTTYNDEGNSSHGTAVVITTGYTTLTSTNLLGIASAAISDTATGTINTWGSRNEVQTSLTIGSDYYVQEDGTITTTSTSPAQLIGKAISATQINIKDYTG